MKKVLLSILLTFLPILASANPVEIDGIWYNLDPKAKEAEVARNPTKYKGNVIIPKNVTHEGVEYSVKKIADNAFFECSGLTSVTIPNSVSSIGDWAFYSCKELTSITIPNSVTSIGNNAFEGCSGLTSITIPNSVTSIGIQAFRECSSLTSVTISDNLTSIDAAAFSGCSGLTSITIPNSVTSIGSYAFHYCSALTSVSIPNSVTTIEWGAFQYCSDLSSITIPNSVKSISFDVFKHCSGLTTVISEIENPFYINYACFDEEVYKNSKLYVPKGTIGKYISTNCWNQFYHIEEGLPAGINMIKRSESEILHEVNRYDARGNLIHNPQRGLNIIHMSDGTTKKVIMR